MTDYLTGDPLASQGFTLDDSPRASYTLRVNGLDRPVVDAWIGESLLYVLRERLGLAGAKSGCDQGECGACSVQVDGQLTAACLVPAALAAGVEIRTVEGLAEDGTPSDVQRALAETGAVQCGFCVPGLAMAVHDLLQRNHEPTELEARQALCGNLCRCTGYAGALAAVRKVAAARAETTAEEPATAPAQEPGTTELGETELDAAGLLDLTGPQDGELPVYVDPLTETTADVPAQHGPYDAGYDYDAYAYQPANGGYGPDDPNSTTGTFTLPTQHRPEAGA
ncbi:(2Fe-2S)-binding protein [Streptacidiphilus monticola]|uniref:(2Fe-2S)-binding protein n=1 Tax=Streptacidiphilus monticola TaxID=2161674 RepID=A0ABW1FVY6_9ACTN